MGSLLVDYAEGPLHQKNLNDFTQSPIPRYTQGHFQFAYGVLDRWAFHINVPVIFANSYRNLPSGQNGLENSLGDIRFETKIQILDGSKYSAGLSVLPYIQAPTGVGFRFTGTNNVLGGITFISDQRLGRFTFAHNLGAQFRKKVNRSGLSLDDLLTYGVGASVSLGWSSTAQIEWVGSTEFGDFAASETSTMELDLSFMKEFMNGITVKVGSGLGLNDAIGTPDYRVMIGTSFTLGSSTKQKSVD